ncbi:MAG: TolC family protein, partial [Pseudohongiella sp.]
EDFFIAAMEYSPRIQVAEARRSIGSARKRAATGQLLPQVSASANVSENRQEVAMEPVTRGQGERYGLQLRQVLFDWQAFARRRSASMEEEQFEAEYFAELSALLTEVAEMYFEVLQAEDALRSIDSELEATQTQLQQIERMHGLQMVQITDLYDAQARLAAVEAERLNLSTEVTLARESLRSVSGLGVGDLYTLGDEAQLPQIDGSVGEWVARAREDNHMILAREYAVKAAERRVSERRGAYMPRVSIIAQQQQSNTGFDNQLLDKRIDTSYVALDVTIPLFAGGSSRAAVSEARSQQTIAQNELRQLHLDVSERTRLAYLRLQSTEQQIAAAEKLLEARRVASRARQRGFELGTVTSVDVLDAVRDEFVAERDLQAIRYEHIKMGLYLRRDSGTLTAHDLVDISVSLEAPAESQ